MPSHEESPSRLEVLRKSPLLQSLTDEERAALTVNARVIFIEKGAHLWTAGSIIDTFVVIGSGYVKLSRIMPGGQEVTSDVMGPGHVLGLLSGLEGLPLPQSAVALSHAWVLKILTKDFVPIYSQNGELKDQLLRRQTERLRRSFEVNAQRTVNSVAQRVASVLLELAENFGIVRGGSTVIEVPLTRREIAEIAGTTVESTIRVMSRWQKSGLIASESREIEVLDLEALRQVFLNGA